MTTSYNPHKRSKIGFFAAFLTYKKKPLSWKLYSKKPLIKWLNYIHYLNRSGVSGVFLSDISNELLSSGGHYKLINNYTAHWRVPTPLSLRRV